MENTTKGWIILGVLIALFFLQFHHVLWSYFRDPKFFWSDFPTVYRRWWKPFWSGPAGASWFRVRKRLIAERAQAAYDLDQAKRQSAAQKRRVDARTACELLFVTHSFDIRERFTREMFDAFVARHLGDDKGPEYVEKLSRELCDIIRNHVEKAVPSISRSDLDAARMEVQRCYDEHADLLTEAFPPVRFRAELRVRITDKSLPHDAWTESRNMIHELLQLVAEEKRNRKNAAQPNRKINPPIENI